MCFCDKNIRGRRLKPVQRVHYFNTHAFIYIISLYLQSVNSDTTNMNRHNDRNVNNNFSFNSQHSNPETDEYDVHEDIRIGDNIFKKFDFDKNPYYDAEEFISKKFYNPENNAYSNYGDYKRYYLNPANPVPRSKVKFKISSKIVQTKYGKLQGIILAMDEHRYLSPLEVFLGVPYATPPVGSNRQVIIERNRFPFVH